MLNLLPLLLILAMVMLLADILYRATYQKKKPNAFQPVMEEARYTPVYHAHTEGFHLQRLEETNIQVFGEITYKGYRLHSLEQETDREIQPVTRGKMYEDMIWGIVQSNYLRISDLKNILQKSAN